MSGFTRRQTFLGTLAAALTQMFPRAPVLAAAAAPPPMPAYAVGIPDEWNWDVIAAPSEDAARRIWAAERCGYDHPFSDDIGSIENCDCDACCSYRDAVADRKPAWDGQDVQAGDAAWFEGGMGAYCGRCNNEAYVDDGGRVVDGEIVCSECLTIDDWDVLDPAYAAELREDLAD